MRRLLKKLLFVVVCFIFLYGILKYTNFKSVAQERLKVWYEETREIADYEPVQSLAENSDINVGEFLDDAEKLTDKAFDHATPENMESVSKKVVSVGRNLLKFFTDVSEELAYSVKEK